jgi:meiosis-specific protein
LQNGYLEAIQLSICTDRSRPAEVIECYTFTFTYSSSSGKSGHDVSSITVSTNSHELLFVGDAQKSFNAAIKGLLKFIRGLPQLPRKRALPLVKSTLLTKTGRRNLGLNLFYTDNCPPSYEPQGFSSCIDDDLYFPGMPGLARKSTKPSRLVVGAHRIGVVVSHVDSEEGQDQLRVIPQNVDYPTKRSRLDEYNVTSEEIIIHHVDPSSQSLPVSLQPPARNNMMASPAAPSTQTRHDIQTKEALQQMQRSSSKPKDLIPTQNLFKADDVDSEDSNNPADQSYMNAICSSTPDALSRKRMIVPAKMAELMIHVRAVQQRCTVGDRVFDQDALDKYEIKRKVTQNVIKCECRDNSDDDGGIMVCYATSIG